MSHIYKEQMATPLTLWQVIRGMVLSSDSWTNPVDMVLMCGASNGAQMVVDLGGGGPIDPTRIRPSFWRKHTGAKGGGTDSIQRSLYWSRGATGEIDWNSPLRVRVAAGPTLFYLDIEGPRQGEAGNSAGSLRQYLFLSPVQPYFADDNPAVVLGGATSTPGFETYDPANRRYPVVHVSANRAGTAAWVRGKIFSLTLPVYDAGPVNHGKWNAYSMVDGLSYLFPWVILEEIDGIRGRLTDLFFGGIDAAQSDSVAGIQAGQVFGYKGGTYKMLRPVLTDGAVDQGGSFGYYSKAVPSQTPLIAVRTTHQGLLWREVELYRWDEMAAMVGGEDI